MFQSPPNGSQLYWSVYTDVTDGMAARGFTNVPVGTYDVRLEGEGFFTEIKRGIRVFPDQATQALFTPRRGAGIHIVEYATGSLPREEIAQRLTKILSRRRYRNE